MTVIDEYLEKIEPEIREQLERIRGMAKKIVPEAEETISYGMPTLKYKGKSFLGFDAHSNHLGIYPYGGDEIVAFKDELDKCQYRYTKGAIQVPYDKPISEELLQKIINHRIDRIVSK